MREGRSVKERERGGGTERGRGGGIGGEREKGRVHEINEVYLSVHLHACMVILRLVSIHQNCREWANFPM